MRTTRSRLNRATIIVAVLCALVGSVVYNAGGVGAAKADVVWTDADSAQATAIFYQRINALRGSKGLQQLQVDANLEKTSKAWTAQMVAAKNISHDGNLTGEMVGNWSRVGENVGWTVSDGNVETTTNRLFDAFVASAHHYENLVGTDWNRAGVGVDVDNSVNPPAVYTTHRFLTVVDKPSTTPTTPQPTMPAPPVTRAPITTTTVKPTTTTTMPVEPGGGPSGADPARVGAVLEALRLCSL